MRPATVLLTAAKVAVLLARCDDPFATRCLWPGQKATALKASALADRLHPVATATNRCPSDLGRTEVDAWNQPFLISCEPGTPITVVVTHRTPQASHRHQRRLTRRVGTRIVRV